MDPSDPSQGEYRAGVAPPAAASPVPDSLPAFSLEQLAALSAELDVGFPRDEVLAGAGLTAEVWAATQAWWLERMAEQVARGRMQLSQRYIKLFSDHRAQAAIRRQQLKRPLEGPLPVPPVFIAPPILVNSPFARASGPAPTGPNTGLPAPSPPMAPSPVAPYPMTASPAAPWAVTAPPSPPPQVASCAPPAVAAAPSVASYTPAAYVPTLTVDQFAMLNAELAVTPPSQHPEVRRRHQLSESSWPLEESAWHARLQSDPALANHYVSKFQYMRALLAPR